MALASVATVSREEPAALEQEEQVQALFREQQEQLIQSQQRARIQEEIEASEEAETDSITGEVKTKNESVKLSSYAGPFLVAIFKDTLDFTIVLALPGPATVLALCAEILIFLLLFFPKRRYKLATNTKLVGWDFSILSTIFGIEGLAFPLNILPFMTGGVAAIYLLDAAFVTARNAKKSSGGKTKMKMVKMAA